MPVPLSALEKEPHLRVLLMGPPKIGKTTAAVTTSPRNVRVILCEADSALNEAKRRGGASYTDFERALDTNKPYEQMTTFLAQAKEEAKLGKLKTLIIDPLSDFADRLLAQSMRANLTQNGEEDGRRGYPHCTKRLLHCIDLAFTIPCHLIVISHYIDVGGQELGLKKTGEGIVPLLPGQARARVAAKFNDVIWFDLDKADIDKRCFYTGSQGAWGPGCRSLSKFATLPANFENLIEVFASGEGLKPTPKLTPTSTALKTTVISPKQTVKPQPLQASKR